MNLRPRGFYSHRLSHDVSQLLHFSNSPSIILHRGKTADRFKSAREKIPDGRNAGTCRKNGLLRRWWPTQPHSYITLTRGYARVQGFPELDKERRLRSGNRERASITHNVCACYLSLPALRIIVRNFSHRRSINYCITSYIMRLRLTCTYHR